MFKKNSFRIGVAISLLCLLAALPILSGCAPAVEQPVAPPGEKPTTAPPPGAKIKVGCMISIGGPLGIDISHMFDFQRDFFTRLNEEEGGISGIPVDVLWFDTEYKLPKSLSGFKRFAEEGVVCVQTQSSGDNEAMKHLFEKNEVVVITEAVSPPGMYPPGWIFGSDCDYQDYFMHFLEWAKAERQEPGPLKVYCLEWDNTIGHSCDEVPKYAEDMGVEIKMEYIPFVVGTDYTGEIVRARDWGASWIFTHCGSTWITQYMKDIDKLGLRDSIRVCGVKYNVQESLAKQAGDLAEGVVIPWGKATWVDDTDGVKLAHQLWEKYHSGEPLPNAESLGGLQESYIVYEGLKRAYEADGWPITGANLKNAMEGFSNVDVLGLTGPITYGPERRIGPDVMRICEIKGGQLTPLTSWEKYTDIPWPGK